MTTIATGYLLRHKIRQGTDIKEAYFRIYHKLSAHRYAPKLFILDNEASGELTSAFHKKNITCQLVPPWGHCWNAAERAIRTWKAHFIAGLCSVNPTFPMSEWTG